MITRNLRQFVVIAVLRVLRGCVVLAGLVGGSSAAAPAKPAAGPPAKPPAAAPLVLDDVPEPLTPSRPRTEAEQDRFEGLALFAAGRAHERRGEDAEALRLYERAFRCDPQAPAIVRAIVPLAYRLDRHAEAVRYALKTANIPDADPLLLRRLGVFLTEEGQWQEAVKLYERALSTRADAKASAADVLLRMEMGRLYHLVDDYKKAADCFAQVLNAMEHPKEFGLDEKIQQILLGEAGPTYSLFGECFLAADRLKEAAAAFEKSHQVAPNKGLRELRRAQIDARSGKPEQALAAVQACFADKLSTEGTAPYELLAEVLEKLGKKEELVGRLEKLHATDADNAPLGYFLAGKYREAKQFDKAEPLYRTLIQKTPTLTGYRSLIEIYIKTKQPDGLLFVLGDAVDKAGVLDTLGAEAQAIAKDADLLRSLVETARKKLQGNPKKLAYGMRLAVALLALEGRQFETAGEFFELAIKAKPDKAAELLLIWGVGLLVEERSAEAATVFRRGIDQKVLPADNPLFHFYLAGALAMQERIDEALEAARAAAEVKPDAVRFHSRIAWVLYRAKRYDDALRAYTELIGKFDSDYESSETRNVLREARLVLSNICVIKDQLPQAEEWLEQVLDEFPDDVGASNDLGYLWADQAKHLERALKMTQLAVAAEPDNAAYRDSLGWALYRLGRAQEALAELEKAAAAKSDPVILDHLGDVYRKLGQRQKAIDAWRRAAQAFEKEKENDKAKQVEQKIQQRK
jgi:tetratricopeptide (TPR) repeat protein